MTKKPTRRKFKFDPAPLEAQLKAMSDQDLQKYADENKIDVSKAGSREAAEAVIVVAAEEKARAEFDAAADKPADRGPELDKVQAATVRNVWDNFSRNVPYGAQSSGYHDLPDDQRKDAPDHGIPNGRYRVLGADWIMIFEDGRFVEAEKATPTTNPDVYREVA